MYLAAVLVLGLLITAGCGPQAETSQCFAMGTVCSQTVAGPEEWLAEGEQMLFAMDARYSWRRTDSEICLLYTSHEIYLSDPRRTAPERLKTVLRTPVREK